VSDGAPRRPLAGEPGDPGLREWLLPALSRLAGGFRSRIDEDTPLLDGGLCLDSLGVMELVTAIEARLDITVQEHEIVAEHFGSVGRLLAFLESHPRHRANRASYPSS
jgi:acyl carrier protein